jgi:hypothetical protein
LFSRALLGDRLDEETGLAEIELIERTAGRSTLSSPTIRRDSPSTISSISARPVSSSRELEDSLHDRRAVLRRLVKGGVEGGHERRADANGERTNRRPQYVVFPNDPKGFALDDQFYLGETGLLDFMIGAPFCVAS